MTAPDHATSHSKNTLRERGHPYMGFGLRPSDGGAGERKSPSSGRTRAAQPWRWNRGGPFGLLAQPSAGASRFR